METLVTVGLGLLSWVAASSPTVALRGLCCRRRRPPVFGHDVRLDHAEKGLVGVLRARDSMDWEMC